MISIIDKILILTFSPILIIVAILVIFFKIIFDGFPIFYNSIRYSSIDKPFNSIKFRSMIKDQAFIEKEIKKYDKDGFEKIPLTSCVYSKFGKFLERTQLVELPQLLNCLLGELSIVGCRPLPKKNLKKLQSKYGVDMIEVRGKRKGGLAGIAQMLGKDNLSNKKRLQLEISEIIFFCEAPTYKKIVVYFLIIFGVFASVILNNVPKYILKIILKNFEKYNRKNSFYKDYIS